MKKFLLVALLLVLLLIIGAAIFVLTFDADRYRPIVVSKLEEALIYPAIRAEIDDDDLMDEALEEHHVVHGLLVELKKMKPSDERYDAKFTVLAENVRHHIEEDT